MAIFNGAVTQSSDDAGESGNGTVTIDGTTIGSGGGATWAALRFQNVTIPPGSIINSAVVDLWFTSTPNSSPNHDIYCQAADNAATFAASSNNISGRPRTTAKTPWTATSIGTGNQNTPDLAAAVQEVIDRDGWSSGNALAIVFDAIASGDGIVFAAYDHATLAAPAITIDYTPPTPDVDVDLDMLSLSASALSLAVVPGGVWLQMARLAAVGSVPTLAVVPGGVAVPVDVLAGVLAALGLTVSVEGVDVTIDLAMLIAELAAEPLAVVPGGVTIALDLLAAILSAYALDVIGTSFDQTVQLALLSAAGGLPSLAVAPGAVTVPLSLLEGQLSLNDLIVFLMLGCAMAVDRERFGALAADAMRFYAVASDRDGCCE